MGSAQQTVTVEATPAAVQSESGEQSYLINSQQVTQLSTNGRSMYTLEALTPGASSIQQDFQIPTSAGNTWNHTQFGGPGQNGGISTNLGSTNFGAVTAAWDPRVLQLGLKLIY